MVNEKLIMLINYSKIINSNIVEIKTQSKLGQISDLIIQKTGLKISGMTLKRGFLERNTRVINTTDIVGLANGAVVVQDEDSVSVLNDNVRMKESYDDGFRGIHQRVVTKSGKNIGIVFDYLVESETLSIAKFYIRTLLSEKIIGISQVVEFSGKKLIIKDETEKTKIATPELETSIV